MRLTGHPSSAKGFTRLELVVAVVVVGFLILATPSLRKTPVPDKDLPKARQIYFGLRMYAEDHEGRFPDARMNANEAYQQLIPAYIESKELFYMRYSAWTPDAFSESGLASKILRAGENHFAYVPGLNMQSNPELPLIAEGFVEGSPGIYTSNLKIKGRVRNGRAVVVRVDGSGKAELVDRLDYRVYGFSGLGKEKRDLFAPAPDWLSAEQVPLNPASK